MPPHSEFQRLLTRPPAERLREFRYRFAQCVIFGLPVLALQWFGPLLSARRDEAVRWVPFLQAVLTGWICYIGALPMLVEGLLLIREKQLLDLLVAGAGIGLYLYSVILLLRVFLYPGTHYRPFLFHGVVILLIAWNGLRWWWTHRKMLSA